MAIKGGDGMTSDNYYYNEAKEVYQDYLFGKISKTTKDAQIKQIVAKIYDPALKERLLRSFDVK